MEALAKLGIDGWGLLLYFVNFGVVFILMHRFVYKPLIKYLDERRNRIKEDVEQATAMRHKLEAERAEEETKRNERLNELDERVKSVKTAARTEAKRMLTEANEQRDAILAQATQAANATIDAAMDHAQSEILERIRRVISYVLEKNVPEAVVKKSVEDSWKTVSKTL